MMTQTFHATEIPALDEALGGGYAAGRVVQLLGDKSRHLALGEMSFLPRYAAKGDTLDELLDDAIAAVRAVRSKIVVIRDPLSVADSDDVAFGPHARKMSRALRELATLSESRGVTVFFDTPETETNKWGGLTDGLGNAIRFYATQRIRVRDEVAEVIKNKVGPVFARVDLAR